MSSKDMTNCPYLPLPQLLSFIVDNRGKTVPTADKGIPLIATNCIKNDELYPVFEKIRYLSEETYENWFRAHPLPGDIIFVNKGTPGKVCFVPDPVNFCIAQDMMAFRVNEKIVDNKYLFAVLRSSQIQTQIEQFHVGTLIPHFKKNDLDKLLIPVPDTKVQKYIGETYYAVCDKIELNNRINKKLEEMTQAIFKNWFVDFEPFQEGEFEASELGRIPKGWRIGTLGNLLDNIKTSEKAGVHIKDIPYVPIDSIPMRSLGLKEFKSGEEAQSSLIHFSKDDILIGAMRVYFHRVVLAPFDGITRTTCFVLRPKQKFLISYALLVCNLDSSIEYAQKTSKGSTMPYAVWDGGLKDLKVIIPEIEIVKSFNELLSPLLRQIRDCLFENKALIDMRDALLPKLMSGEIRVPIGEVQ